MRKKRVEAGWLVTGAGSGFGREVARRLAGRGERLALLDRDRAGLDATAALLDGPAPHLEVADVTDPPAIREAVERSERALGALGHVFHSAGVLATGHVEELPAAEYRRMIEVNYLGSVHVAQATLPALRRASSRGRATLTLVASIGGLRGFPEMAGYCASKFAVVGFAQALAAELVGTDVEVKALCPPAGDTPMVRNLERRPPIYKLSPLFSAETVVEGWLDQLDRRDRVALVDLQSKALWRLDRLAPRVVDLVVRLAR
ncbi:MAG: SDR family oxidoreductase [Sandaracinaceae bacterium]|nr:SDR family oxidoreductase [Sandaracinaceae bacterium]